jgi:predicted DNA-binding transcriptional regulator AlpA
MIRHIDQLLVSTEHERPLPECERAGRTLRRTDMSITQPAESPDTLHARDELLTMKEVAGVVRVPVATLRYWRHLGSGPRSFRVGRSVRYWRTDVLHWLEQQSNDPQASR